MLTGLSHYIVAAVLARTEGSVEAFAAYSLGKSLSFLFETPAAAMRTAATSMATHEGAWRIVHRTALAALACTFGAQALLYFSPAGDWVLANLAGVPGTLVADTVRVSRWLAFAMLGSSLRFIYHGILVRWRATDGVMAGVLARLAVMAAAGWAVTAFRWPAGGGAGAVVLALGMLAEGLVGYISYRRAERRVSVEWKIPQASVAPRSVLRFVMPLALSGSAMALMRPTMNAGLAAGGPEAVAAFALAITVVDLIHWPATNLHQVTMVFTGNSRGSTLRFALGVGAVFSALTAVMAVAPIGQWILGSVVGADWMIIPGALLALAALIPLPLITAASEDRMGLLFLARSSRAVSLIRLVRLVATVGLLWLLLPEAAPAFAPALASAAMVGGAGAELLLLQAILVRTPAVGPQASAAAR